MNLKHELRPHQIYVLRLLAAPPNLLRAEYLWDAENVADGLLSKWLIAFTGWYLASGKDLLAGLGADIREINDELQQASIGTNDLLWTDEALESNKFWENVRSLSELALQRRGIEVCAPDPDGWFEVLPEELH